MEIDKIVNEKDDIIKQLYNNNLYLSEKIPDNLEYEQITQKISNLETNLLNINDNLKNKIKEYLEIISERESIEMEFQFELGFKTAIRLIIKGIH